MNQQQTGTTGLADQQDLGASFEAQNSQSDGRALGSLFERHNAVSPEEHEAILEKRRRKPHTWLWITIGVLVLLAAFLVFRSHSKKPAAASGAASGGARSGRGQSGPATITVGDSQTGNINVYVDALGTVTPVFTTTIFSQITGRVLAVHYREGQIVHKGDPLVDIDPRPYQATLDQAQGTLERDRAVLAEAKIDLDRYQAAFARNAIARQQLEDQQQVVLQDQGTVKTDEGTVAYDQVQLAYCHIVAPITGKVGLRLVDPGNTVFSGTGSTLVVITQLQPITVVFNVSEDNLPAVQAQLKAGHSLVVDAYDRSNDKLLESGKLTSLDNQIDTTTGTIKFRATFNNHDLGLTPNQFVNARLLLKTLQNVTLVPTAAVQQNGTQAFVYLVKQGKDKQGNDTTTVAVQNVTAQTSNEKVTAVQGLPANTPLATSGFDRLENGAQVTTRQQGNKKPDASSAASAPATGSKAP
jgi:multidrug efflux system membrane fusion protein